MHPYIAQQLGQAHRRELHCSAESAFDDPFATNNTPVQWARLRTLQHQITRDDMGPVSQLAGTDWAVTTWTALVGWCQVGMGQLDEAAATLQLGAASSFSDLIQRSLVTRDLHRGPDGTLESEASDAYRDALVAASADDVMLTTAFTGLPTSMLRSSVVRAGLDPDHLDEQVSVSTAAPSTAPTPPT